MGAPLELISQAFVTPQDCFFVRNHGAVPHVDAHRYRLIVTGRVRVPLELSLDELRAHFPASTVMATLQCAGHRRDELAAFRPIPGEIPWGAETIGNAVWRGVALREVLRAAGVGDSVKHVAFLGLDALYQSGERFAFGGSIPIEKAMSAEVLLASGHCRRTIGGHARRQRFKKRKSALLYGVGEDAAFIASAIAGRS